MVEPHSKLLPAVRLYFSIFYGLLYAYVGGLFSAQWGNGSLLIALLIFLFPSALRFRFVRSGKWNPKFTLLVTFTEAILMAGLTYVLMVHVKEGPRFLLQPFSYGFFISLLVFSAAEAGRAELLTTLSNVLILRVMALALCLRSGVVFNLEFSYLDRFVYLGHEAAYFAGFFATSAAAYFWAPKKIVSRFSAVALKDELSAGIASAAKKAPEIRTAFLLYINICDFAAVSAKASPGQVRRLLREYHNRTEELIARHGGQIQSKEGSGMLAHFGVKSSDSKAAAKGMSCLEELIACLDHWNQDRAAQNEFFVECGFSGVVANFFLEKKSQMERLDLDLVGESVNLIKQLENHNLKINARASTTRQTLEMAAAQGFVLSSYVRSLPKEKIDSLPFKLDVVVLAERPQADAKRKSA